MQPTSSGVYQLCLFWFKGENTAELRLLLRHCSCMPGHSHFHTSAGPCCGMHEQCQRPLARKKYGLQLLQTRYSD